jgi:hypothetical protein
MDIEWLGRDKERGVTVHTHASGSLHSHVTRGDTLPDTLFVVS